VRVFGIDPGSERTGYGCVETDGRRHRLIACGAISLPARSPFPERLAWIHRELGRLLAESRPDCVAIENLFHASNARSALKLGHARGVAMLAAVQAHLPLLEYTPAEVKRAVVGYGRADKGQMQHMVALLLGLATPPTPHDAADALAVAICHVHRTGPGAVPAAAVRRDGPRSWRQVRPEDLGVAAVAQNPTPTPRRAPASGLGEAAWGRTAPGRPSRAARATPRPGR
jgi:crossover junction endodeoxyribonuclease RuvC